MPDTRKKWLCAVLTVFSAAAYSALLFSLKPSFVGVSWLAYGFTMLAFAALIADAFIPKARRVKYALPRLPIMGYSLVYALVQLVYGTLILSNNQFSLTVACVSEALLLALYAAAWAYMCLGKEFISRQDREANAKRMYIQTLAVTLEGIESRAAGMLALEGVRKLKQAVAYSDPMSHASLAFVEERIENCVEALNDDVINRDEASARATLDTLNRLLNERNEKCKMLK